MTDREYRLRLRIDQLTDQRDRALEQLAEARLRARRWWAVAYALRRSRDVKQLQLQRLRKR